MGTDLRSKPRNSQEYIQAVQEYAFVTIIWKSSNFECFRLGKLIVHRVTLPWLHNDYLYKLLHGKLQNKYLKILHNFTSNVIIDREQTFKADQDTKTDEQDVSVKKRLAMLDLLLKEKINNNIDFEGVREEVDTFMFEVRYNLTHKSNELLSNFSCEYIS